MTSCQDSPSAFSIEGKRLRVRGKVEPDRLHDAWQDAKVGRCHWRRTQEKTSPVPGHGSHAPMV